MTSTEERLKRPKKIGHGGTPASRSAGELGGVTRNAVIGKAHRLGLEQRPSPVKAGEEKEAKKPAPLAAATRAAPKAEAPRTAPETAAAPRPAPVNRSAPEMQYRSIGP